MLINVFPSIATFAVDCLAHADNAWTSIACLCTDLACVLTKLAATVNSPVHNILFNQLQYKLSKKFTASHMLANAVNACRARAAIMSTAGIHA